MTEDAPKPPFRILDNAQSALPENTMLMLLETRDLDSGEHYLKPFDPEAPPRPPMPSITVKTYVSSSPEWIKDKTLAEFVATFPVMEEYPAPKPDWFMNDEQGRELRRASNRIAMTSRRGTARSIYHNGDLKGSHAVYDGNPFVQIVVDWVPKGYAFVVYEATPMDVPFLYKEGFGILPNKNYQNYGRLVRIID